MFRSFLDPTSRHCPSQPARQQRQWPIPKTEPCAANPNCVRSCMYMKKVVMRRQGTYIYREDSDVLIFNFHGVLDRVNIRVELARKAASNRVALRRKGCREAGFGVRHLQRRSSACIIIKVIAHHGTSKHLRSRSQRPASTHKRWSGWKCTRCSAQRPTWSTERRRQS